MGRRSGAWSARLAAWGLGALVLGQGALLTRVLSGRLPGVVEERPRGPRWRLIEKGAFQHLYRPDGTLERIVHDADGDGVAETVVLYEGGRVRRAERDTDADGRVDRWEDYDPRGRALERVGRSRRRPGVPDEWIHPGPDGEPARVERDYDGDGRVDDVEHIDGGRLVYREMDSDADGRLDRWLRYRSGRAVSDERDTDGDGIPDRSFPVGR